jgi:hypothetical protein
MPLDVDNRLVTTMIRQAIDRFSTGPVRLLKKGSGVAANRDPSCQYRCSSRSQLFVQIVHRLPDGRISRHQLLRLAARV